MRGCASSYTLPLNFSGAYDPLLYYYNNMNISFESSAIGAGQEILHEENVLRSN
jgi:hypothetical protein